MMTEQVPHRIRKHECNLCQNLENSAYPFDEDGNYLEDDEGVELVSIDSLALWLCPNHRRRVEDGELPRFVRPTAVSMALVLLSICVAVFAGSILESHVNQVHRLSMLVPTFDKGGDGQTTSPTPYHVHGPGLLENVTFRIAPDESYDSAGDRPDLKDAVFHFFLPSDQEILSGALSSILGYLFTMSMVALTAVGSIVYWRRKGCFDE